MNRTSMKIKVNFVNMLRHNDTLAFVLPSVFVTKDYESYALCFSWLFWGVGIVFYKNQNESE